MVSSLRVKSLLSGSGGIVLSRLGGAGAGFLTQFLLVKLMGAAELGLFYAASSLAAVLGVFLSQGYPQVAARFIGRYRNKQDAALAGRFATQAIGEGLAAALLGAVAVIVWACAWPGFETGERLAYAIAAVMLLAIVSLNIITNIAGGMRAFVLCYVPEGLFRPLAFLLVCATAGLTGVHLTGAMAMLIFAVITTAVAVSVALSVIRRMPRLHWRIGWRGRLPRRWRIESWQLLLTAVFTNFFADACIFISTPFLSHSDTAVFGLCLKLALLVGYFIQIGQQMAVPDMADARHSDDEEHLRRAAWRSIKGPSAIAALAVAASLLFGRQFLSYFGADFAAGAAALSLLLGAQLLRALAGPGVHQLVLSGKQGPNIALASSALIVLFLASAMLCPKFGPAGGAIAVLVVQAYWNVASICALKWLGEPSLDVIWVFQSRSFIRLRARPA